MKRNRIISLAILCIAICLAFLPMLSVNAEFGTGWTVQYYNNTNLSGSPVLSEALASGINFNYGTSSPRPGVVNDDNFSARYSSVQLFNAGTYEFIVSSDDGVRIIIDGATVLDRFIGRELTTDRIQINLTAGTHSIIVEYFEGIDQSAIQFQWFQISGGSTPGTGTAVGGGGGVFSTPIGTPPGTAVYSGPTASVTGARGLALRTGPYIGASFITTLGAETAYPALARNRDEGVYNWYKLRVGEREGWASGRFLTISVDPNTLPEEGTIFDNIDNASDIGARAYPRAVMNLRERPSPRTPQIASIPWGAELALVGRTVQAGTNRWLQVRFEDKIGWIDARWVTIRGEIFQVPIR